MADCSRAKASSALVIRLGLPLAGDLLHLGFVSRKSFKRARGLIASVLAALWLFTGFAAVSAELHHCVHDDAPSEHQCSITKYADGQFLDAPQGVSLGRIEGEFAEAISSSSADLPIVDFLLPPGRAPPVF